MKASRGLAARLLIASQGNGLQDESMPGSIWRIATMLLLLCLCALTGPVSAATTNVTLPAATVGVGYNQTVVVPYGGICDTVGYEYASWDNAVVLTPLITDPTNCSFTLIGTPSQVGTAVLTVKLYDSSFNVLATYVYSMLENAFIATSVGLSATPATTSYGSSVALTATLAGTNAGSGNVTFKDGATTLGVAGVAGYVASMSTSALAAGSHSITAVFDGDSTSSAIATVIVTAATPTVTLGTSTSASTYGSAVNLTASLSGPGIITGTVTFKDGVTTLGSAAVAGGAATFSTSALAVGGHSITAVYSGDVNHAGVTTSSVSVTVGQITPVVSLSSSTSSASFGSALTLTASVSSAASPGGSVIFKDGTTTLGSAAISGGTASLTVASLGQGGHTITAVYGGDANNLSATSASVLVTITQVATGVTLGVSAASASYGATLTLTASISGGNAPGGTVTFMDGASNLGSVTVSSAGASLNIASLAVGTHGLTAIYSGDTNNVAATSAVASVTIVKLAPAVSLAASASSVSANTALTFTATLSGGSTPSGTITFKDGATSLGSVSISGAGASLTISSLAVGSHSITATYNGDANNSAQNSGVVMIAVAAITPAISGLVPANGPALGGTSVVISGVNLGSVSAVTFGGIAARIAATGATSVTVITPVHAAGAVDVSVTTAIGSYTVSGGFVYGALPDPTAKASVVALVTAQTQAVQRFSTAQLNNFSQRLESLHGDGWARSSFNLGITPPAGQVNADNAWARRGDVMNLADSGLATLRSGLRKTGLAAATATTASGADAGNLPELPQASSVATRQEISWWIGGALDLGQQRSNGVQSGFKLTTGGVSFGGDYRLGSKLTLGLGMGYSRSHYVADDEGSRSVGQGVMAVAYASVRPLPHVYVDAVAGYGVLHFDLTRYVSESGSSAMGSRGGRQVFGSLTAGYEWQGDGWMWSPFGRLDIARATLDSYTETGGGIGALSYFRQTVRNDAASLGMRGELRYELADGTLMPQARVAYQHGLQGTGRAAIRYADPSLSSPIYTVADTAQDSSQWVSSLGLKLLLKNSIALSLMYSHSIANSQTSTQSINFNLSGKF